jgi:uncharacterized linocin/CFP29 family protein
MDILRKSMAPICDEAWEEINENAIKVFTSVLSARKFIDVEVPKGWDFSALAMGRLEIPTGQSGDVHYGIRQVLPLIEARVPFELNIWELDNIVRGTKNIDLDNMEEAARKLARFEEDAIYKGFKPGHIKGIKECLHHDSLKLPADDDEIVEGISEAIVRLKTASVEGPYSLVLNARQWKRFNSSGKGYPLQKRVENLLGGSIIMAPYVEDAYLISERGGDFEMVIGQDISIGYESHTQKAVQLYFTESFTFHVINPDAVVLFK